MSKRVMKHFLTRFLCVFTLFFGNACAQGGIVEDVLRKSRELLEQIRMSGSSDTSVESVDSRVQQVLNKEKADLLEAQKLVDKESAKVSSAVLPEKSVPVHSYSKNVQDEKVQSVSALRLDSAVEQEAQKAAQDEVARIKEARSLAERAAQQIKLSTVAVEQKNIHVRTKKFIKKPAKKKVEKLVKKREKKAVEKPLKKVFQKPSKKERIKKERRPKVSKPVSVSSGKKSESKRKRANRSVQEPVKIQRANDVEDMLRRSKELLARVHVQREHHKLQELEQEKKQRAAQVHKEVVQKAKDIGIAESRLASKAAQEVEQEIKREQQKKISDAKKVEQEKCYHEEVIKEEQALAEKKAAFAQKRRLKQEEAQKRAEKIRADSYEKDLKKVQERADKRRVALDCKEKLESARKDARAKEIKKAQDKNKLRQTQLKVAQAVRKVVPLRRTLPFRTFWSSHESEERKNGLEARQKARDEKREKENEQARARLSKKRDHRAAKYELAQKAREDGTQRKIASLTRNILLKRAQSIKDTRRQARRELVDEELQEQELQERFDILSFEQGELLSMVDELSEKSSLEEFNNALELVFECRERYAALHQDMSQVLAVSCLADIEKIEIQRALNQRCILPLRDIEQRLLVVCGLRADSSAAQQYRDFDTQKQGARVKREALEHYLGHLGREGISQVVSEYVSARLAQEQKQMIALRESLQEEVARVSYLKKADFVQGCVDVLEEKKYSALSLIERYEDLLEIEKIKKYVASVEEFSTTIRA